MGAFNPIGGTVAGGGGGSESVNELQKRYVKHGEFASVGAGYDFIAPRYMVLLGETKIQDDIASRIRDIHVDFDVDKATEIRISAHDHDGMLRDGKYFQPGGVVHVWVGYGQSLEYLASGEIVKWAPDYPREGKPVITIHAYDGSHASMDRQGHKGGSVMKSVRDSRVVTHKISEHMGHFPDVDQSDGIFSRIQRKGISDYQFVKRLALLNNYYYWCDWSLDLQRWVGHFRDRDKLHREQEQMYSFIYGDDVAVSLLEFKLDFTARGMPTDIEIVSFDRDEKKPVKVAIRETKGLFTDHAPGRGTTDPSERKKQRRRESIFVHKINEPTTYHGLGVLMTQQNLLEASTFTDVDKVGPPEKGTTLTFTAFGQRIYVVSDKPFKNMKDAAGWAARFMKARLTNFIHGAGAVVGTPGLRPRQIHYLGTGDHFAGKWEFTKVTHKILTDGPYEVQFEARRVYEPTDPTGNPTDCPIVPRMMLRSEDGLQIVGGR